MKKIVKDSSQKDKVLAVLEKMQDKIQIIAEGQQLLRGEMNRNFDEVSQRFSGIEDNLKIALEYLFRIDEEITKIKTEIKEMKKKDKISESWMVAIEKRIGIIEKRLKIQKQLAK